MECQCVIETAARLFGERQAPMGRALVDVDGGDTFAVAVDRDGRAVGWGRAFYGELGEEAEGEDEDEGARDTCVRELALRVDCTSVACGQNHVLVASRDGTSVFAWGWNRWGQVGDMPEAAVTTPTRVPFDDSAIAIQFIAAGGMHSLAVDSSGRAWSWGQNKFGQLGRKTVDSERCGTPDCVALPADVKARQVAAGWAHTALLSTDGSVLTFGWGLYYQLGHGTAQNERKPTVVDALLGLDVASRVVQVACGTWHTAVRTASGDLYTWGWGPDGQLGHGKTTVSHAYPRVVDLPPLQAAAPKLASPPNAADVDGEDQDLLDVACSARFTVGLLRNGYVVWCGLRSSSSASETAWRVARHFGEGQARKIAAGATHAFALVESVAEDAHNS